MLAPLICDEDLLRRLPTPLAQLVRRAHNAKTSLERHHAAYYCWEAALKLLGSVAIIEFVEVGSPDADVTTRLSNLARPSLGHWQQFVRLLVPRLADAGDTHFAEIRNLLTGRPRDDLPRTAGLDGALLEAMDGHGGPRSTVRVSELFDHLVRYRNREIGHGATGQRKGDFYERMAKTLLAGIAELLGRLDVLAGRRLIYVADVRRQSSGAWLIERYELRGESARRIESVEAPEDDVALLPRPERLYVGWLDNDSQPVRSLHPLLLYDTDAGETLFLNARRGRRRTEYLCYTTGNIVDREELVADRREFLAHALGTPVDDGKVAAWAAQAEEAESSTGVAAPPEGDEATAEQRIGEFELLSKMGQGGMGVVYRAWQPSLGRHVALKCLLRVGDPKAEARFAREIRALGHVEHPHLVKIFTSGVDRDRWFFTMELVEGSTLAAVCDKLQTQLPNAAEVNLDTWRDVLTTACAESRRAEQPLAGAKIDALAVQSPNGDNAVLTNVGRSARTYVRQVVELMRQVALATEALHEAGIIHRDIKPGNIIISSDGSHAALMDLGLAQLADQIEGRLTRTRQFVGTLRYASPEQVLAVRALDRRSDVYSLGATLWELLALRPIYGATDQTPTPELMERIQREEPERLRKLHPGISADLEAIVFKCLEKDPAQRYGTAREFADDLRRFVDDEPVVARPVGSWERARKWARRRPAAAALLAVSGLALLALVGFAVGLFYNVQLQDYTRQLQAALDEAKRQRAAAHSQRERAEAQQKIADEQRRNAEAAHMWAEKQRMNAVNNQMETERQRARADQQALLARSYQYAADVQLAQQYWDEGQTWRVLELLQRHRPKPDSEPDLRSFEWGYMWRLAHADLLTLSGHDRSVNAIAFSPDGKRLVSISHASSGAGTLSKFTVDLDPNGKDEGAAAENASRPDATSEGDAIPGPEHDGPIESGEPRAKVIVWNVSNGQPVLTLAGPRSFAFCVAFSPGGKYFAVGGGGGWPPWHQGEGNEPAQGELTVWDAETGAEVCSLEGHGGYVYGIAFSPDSRQLASAAWDGMVRIWDLQAKKIVLTFEDGGAAGGSVAFSPDGNRLATTSGKVWDLATGQMAYEVNEVRRCEGLTFSPDRHRLAAVTESYDGRKVRRHLKLWNAKTGQETLSTTNDNETNRTSAIAFSPDASRFVTGGADGVVRLCNAGTGEEIAVFKGHLSCVHGVAFSPDGDLIASSSSDGTIKLWDVTREPDSLTLRDENNAEQLAFAADNRRVFAVQTYQRFKAWDTRIGVESTTLDVGAIEHGRLGVSPDGSKLAIARWHWNFPMRRYEDVWIEIRDVKSGQQTAELRGGHTSYIDVMAFSRDGRRLASGGDDRRVIVWDLNSGQSIHGLQGCPGTVSSLAFSPDGQRLAAANGARFRGGEPDSEVKVWDIATGEEVASWKQRSENALLSLAFSPEGNSLVAGNEDGTLTLINFDEEGESRTLFGHRDAVRGLAFTPDGKRFVSGSDDHTVKIWDVSTGQDLLTLKGHTHWVQAVSFSHNGNLLATASADDTIRVWEAVSPTTETVPDQDQDLRQRRIAWRKREAAAAAKEKRWFAAAFHLDRLIDEIPDDANLNFDRGLARASLGQWEPARADLSRNLELKPDDIRSFYVRAHVYEQLGKPIEAVADYSRAIELAPANDRLMVELLLRRGRIFSGEGDTEKALADYTAAIELTPENVEPWLRRGLVHQRLRQWNLAIADLTHVLQHEPKHVLALRRRGEASAELGNLPAALADFSQALELAADTVSLWSHVATLQLALGQTEAYRRTCADLLERFGRTRNPATANSAAWALTLGPGALDDFGPARRLAEMAVAADGANQVYLHTLGAIEFRAGRFDAAIQQFHESLAADPSGGGPWHSIFLAMAHHRLGQAQEAEHWWEKTVTQIDQISNEQEFLSHLTDAATADAAGDAPTRIWTWSERLQLDLLRREAEALFN